jgi:ABC-type phosphate transport system substrate-binding protein
VKAVAADPKAIGYVDSTFVNMTVKVVRTVK